MKNVTVGITPITITITAREEMRTPNALLTAAAYCAASAAAFQPSLVLRPEARAIGGGAAGRGRTRAPSPLHHAVDDDVASGDDVVANPSRGGDDDGGAALLLEGESPASLGPRRSFLGLRRESGALRRLMEGRQQQRRSRAVVDGRLADVPSTTALSSSATALMPDGGLSPCVIKVLGVGGGGSNAVRP